MSSDNRHALGVLGEQLIALPIEAHLLDDLILIERCRIFLDNILRFWQRHKAGIPSVDALTTIISHDYHHVMKTGSREVRHLINIMAANREELMKVKAGLPTDSALAKLETKEIEPLLSEGLTIDRLISTTINDQLATFEHQLNRLRKASVKLWDHSAADSSVIPKGIFVFISHATNDKDLAVKISKELESIGIATWRDDKDIIGGDSIPTEISKGLEKATHFAMLYTNKSKDRAWVKTESETALMLREQSGKPKIIPLLLDGLRPPTILGNIKGISFEQFEPGITALWKSLGVPASSRISLDILFKFQKRARQALEQVQSCHQSDKCLEIDDPTFDELEDLETYFATFPILGNEKTYRRFKWTMVSWPTQRPEEIRPTFESEFYSYRRAAIAGCCLLKSVGAIAEQLLKIVERIEGKPLPQSISGGSA
ncbi:MAG: toll/interleukin-1 receptor domain-containing protein [Elusimicrobia bacterium]|nr:toll/interleukin-1 receptor domain-containing protein [Elusimicrobiota bacterium]